MSDRDEVLDRAIELWEKDRQRQRDCDDQQVLEEAAKELGVPAEYIQHAADSIAADKHLHRRSRQLSLQSALIVGALVLGGFSVHRLVSPPIPMADGPWHATFDDSRGWVLRSNPGSRARFSTDHDPERGDVATIHVDHFETPPDGRYYVNLRATPVPATLGGYQVMRLWVRGEGLDAVRVYPRGDRHERWRSPEIPVTNEWTEHVIELTRFDHQVGGRANWRTRSWEPPGSLDRLQIKVGYFINDVSAQGYVSVDDLRFE